MSSLGFQLVYALLNEMEGVVCERFFVEPTTEKMLSIESGRELSQFPFLFFSVSFEDDFTNIARVLLQEQVSMQPENKDDLISSSSPLVAAGGVATSINPEPLASMIELFFLGEAEGGLGQLVTFLVEKYQDTERAKMLEEVQQTYTGAYVPQLYSPVYDDGQFTGFEHAPALPFPIAKAVLESCSLAGHSQLMSPEAEFSDLYLTELGRGCSRGCRFCTAAFIYRPPRLWEADAVVGSLKERFEGKERVGLLGMEMARDDNLGEISEYLMESGCSLSFSSLRADRIDDKLIPLLEKSGVKSVAIAPDGSSERLRRVINKNLNEADILAATEKIALAGITKLKIYLMIGLPTETEDDIDEFIGLIDKIQQRINPIGQQRKRLTEITISVNCFAPKPWTPFQFHPFGLSDRIDQQSSGDWQEVVRHLKKRQKKLAKVFSKVANVSIKMDKPEEALLQTLLSKGDRRLGEMIQRMARTGCSWKRAIRETGIHPEKYVLKKHGPEEKFPWSIIDHGIQQNYLWKEYQRSLEGKLTGPCEPAVCRKCGVCGDPEK